MMSAMSDPVKEDSAARSNSTGRVAAQRVRARVARYGVVVALALAVVGCGNGDSGDGDQQSGTEAWADDVCTAVGSWKDAIADAQTTLSDTANLSANDIRDALDNVATATDNFATDLDDIGPPDTEAGDEAEQQLATLSDKLKAQESVIEDAVGQNSDTLNELLAQVSIVTGALSTMITDALSTVDAIRQLDGATELNNAFENAPSCQDL